MSPARVCSGLALALALAAELLASTATTAPMRIVAAAADSAAVSPPATRNALHSLTWSKLQAEGRLTVGTLVPRGRFQGFDALRVENRTDRPQTFAVACLDSLRIRQADWVLTGKVQCIAVEGRAYLEMVNYFPDGEVHFAKTLDRKGPTRWLEGNTAWRDFALVFHAFKPHRPSRIVINVVLPRPGVVELGPLSLHEGKAAVKAALGKR